MSSQIYSDFDELPREPKTEVTTTSFSELQLYKNCPLAYRLQYEVGLRADAHSNYDMAFGSAIHLGLEALYKGDYAHVGSAARNDLVKQALDAFREACPTPPMGENAKTRESGVEALLGYVAQWSDPDRDWKILDCEAAYQREDGWISHLDLTVEDTTTGNRYAVDHKTVGGSHVYLSYKYWQKFAPNSQVRQYLITAKERYGAIDGFYVNAISFGYRSRRSANGGVGTWQKYERQMFNVDDEILRQEQEATAMWLDRLAASRATSTWPYNTDSCYSCQYRAMCEGGWQWGVDDEVIRNQYHLACNQLTDTLRRCALPVGHAGECAEYDLSSDTAHGDDMLITVD